MKRLIEYLNRDKFKKFKVTLRSWRETEIYSGNIDLIPPTYFSWYIIDKKVYRRFKKLNLIIIEDT